MRSTIVGLIAAAAFCLAPMSAEPASAQAARGQSAKIQMATDAGGTVYLFRGLADVFSTGMNQLARELRGKGIRAVAESHTNAHRLAEQLVRDHKAGKPVAPVILIGHSLGANRTLSMSAWLAREGVPVRLVVLFDATVNAKVPRNVQEVLNLYKPGPFGRKVTGVEGYRGTIVDRDVSSISGIGHVSIDKSKTLHTEVVAKVQRVFAERRPRRR